MALRIITPDQRLARPRPINIAIFGPSGVGKTTLARGLDPETTLFVNLEAGDLALGDWPGSLVNVREDAADLGVHPWELCRALACLMSGADPADQAGPYSAEMLKQYEAAVSPRSTFDQYTTVFWDSVTVAGRYSFEWAKAQPEAFSEKTGKPDTRGAYGLHGRELVRWFTNIQHTPGKSTVIVGILDRMVDDLKRVTHEIQIDGSKASRELPGIFDVVATLDIVDMGEAGKHRAFVCHQQNPFGYPAKDRSGCLELVEPPDLAELMAKIRAGKRLDGVTVRNIPQQQ